MVEVALAKLRELAQALPRPGCEWRAVRHSTPPASPKDIAALERAAGFSLPADLRAFLAHADAVVGMSVHNGYHVGGTKLMTRLVKAKEVPLQVPDGPAAPVALDGGGNGFLVSASGRVWRWDHETSQVRLVADSFTAFLNRVAADWAAYIAETPAGHSWYSDCATVPRPPRPWTGRSRPGRSSRGWRSASIDPAVELGGLVEEQDAVVRPRGGTGARDPGPAPNRAAAEAVWCGASNGGRRIRAVHRPAAPLSEWTAVTSIAASSSRSGSRPGSRSASIVLPDPGGPTMSRRCPPRGGDLQGQAPSACPATSARSGAARVRGGSDAVRAPGGPRRDGARRCRPDRRRDRPRRRRALGEAAEALHPCAGDQRRLRRVGRRKTTIRSCPARTAAMTAGRMPRTGRSAPSRPSRPGRRSARSRVHVTGGLQGAHHDGEVEEGPAGQGRRGSG